MTSPQAMGSRFLVDLGDVKLPELLEKQVETEIQSVVLRALAEGDFGFALAARTHLPIWNRFPGHTLGLWIGPEDEAPVWPSPSVPMTGAPLTISDHTLIVTTVMKHALSIARALPAEVKVRGETPAGSLVLKAALRVADIDRETKQRIRAVLAILPMLEEAMTKAPASVRTFIDRLKLQLEGKSVDEQREVFRLECLNRKEDDGLAIGMRTAIDMLDHGNDTIYSRDFDFYTWLTNFLNHLFPTTGNGSTGVIARDSVLSGTSSADTVGATAGGAVGAAVAGVGAAPGAVALGAGMSAGYLIGSFIKWLF